MLLYGASVGPAGIENEIHSLDDRTCGFERSGPGCMRLFVMFFC